LQQEFQIIILLDKWLPVGIKLFGLQNTITISGTPTATGTFSYIPLTGGCGTVIYDRTITVIQHLLVSIAGSATVCTGTNSTTLTLSGHTGTVGWESSTDAFATTTTIDNTTTSLTATI
jgi:hypothetical protein